MKKTFACILSAMLLLTWSFALAETTETAESEYATYTNAYYNYTIDYPADWFVLDSETIKDIMKNITSGDVPADAFTAEAITMLDATFSQAADGDIVEFMDRNGSNFNVTCFEFPTLASIELVNYVFSPQIVTMYTNMIAGIEFLDSGSIYQLDGRDFIHIKCQYIMNGIPLTLSSLYYFDNGMVYNFSFTWSAGDEAYNETFQQIMEHALASFTLV